MTQGQVKPPKPHAHERRQRDPERTKLEILAVATQEFADRGFAGARVDEIAAQTCEVYTVADSKVIESWVYGETMSLFNQIAEPS